MQSCLTVHARSLRVTKESAVVTSESNRKYHFEDTAHVKVDLPLCSPNKKQMDYYIGLYINRSILCYALKAEETDKNSTEPAVSEENYAVIANISDHSRFSPAGMETANKATCAKILLEIDAEASLFSNTALCGWDYICDYKADRFPNYLFKARCKTERCKGDCSHSSNNMCQSHGINVCVLQMRKNCSEWVWSQELLPIACICTSDIGMIITS